MIDRRASAGGEAPTACGAYSRLIGAPRLAGPQPRDSLRRALMILRRASAGGAPAPRQPAARTHDSSAPLGWRGPSPATACGDHHRRAHTTELTPRNAAKIAGAGSAAAL